MPAVHFVSHQIKVEAPLGATLLEAARQAGIDLESPCNGTGACGKCRLRVLAGQPRQINDNEDGAELLSAQERQAGWALACHSAVDGDLEVEIPVEAETKHQILSEGLTRERPLRPWLRKRHEPDLDATFVFAGSELLDEEPGDTSAGLYGLAVDIGTTTLVTALVDLTSGRQIGSVSSINPQTVFGHDVLSRIQFAGEGDGLQVLQSRLIDELNRMTAELAARHGARAQHIYESVFSGNTTMLHLAVGADPRSLGRYPYTPALAGNQSFSAASIGLRIAAQGRVYLPPFFDAYVGADIVSGVLATGLNQFSGVTLFIDIGTNGEMILAVDGRLHATSTAAGPAFEGMNISCGMRAAAGAIEYFNVLDGGEIVTRVIGGAKPAGICGSGLVDVVGELAAAGVIEPSGRFIRHAQGLAPGLSARLAPRDGKPAFLLGSGVYLSQKDVRQVQLAKGAVRAGIDTLLRVNHLEPEKVDRVLIAGSFGYHLRPESLINLGLLPAAFRGKVEFAGNTSKTGAQLFLTDHVARNEMAAAILGSGSVDLAHAPDFEKTFVKALEFGGGAKNAVAVAH